MVRPSCLPALPSSQLCQLACLQCRVAGHLATQTGSPAPSLPFKAAPPSHSNIAGSAISSIDPVATLAVLADMDVPPLLYNLVFGESVLNE